MKKLLIKPCAEFLSDDIGYTSHYLNDKQIVGKIIEASNVIAASRQAPANFFICSDDASKKMTEDAKRNLNEMRKSVGIDFDFASLYPYMKSYDIRAEEKRGKQIFSDIDPYGEESWEE